MRFVLNKSFFWGILFYINIYKGVFLCKGKQQLLQVGAVDLAEK
jgi:hypothetical protein